MKNHTYVHPVRTKTAAKKRKQQQTSYSNSKPNSTSAATAESQPPHRQSILGMCCCRAVQIRQNQITDRVASPGPSKPNRHKYSTDQAPLRPEKGGQTDVPNNPGSAPNHPPSNRTGDIQRVNPSTYNNQPAAEKSKQQQAVHPPPLHTNPYKHTPDQAETPASTNGDSELYG